MLFLVLVILIVTVVQMALEWAILQARQRRYERRPDDDHNPHGFH